MIIRNVFRYFSLSASGGLNTNFHDLHTLYSKSLAQSLSMKGYRSHNGTSTAGYHHSSTSSSSPAADEAPSIRVIDLRSDTVTAPSPSMRAAMAGAVVGDDVYGEDPTVAELERVMATLTGKEAGLFVPSGTMANLISVLVHCSRRGSEVLLGDLSHLFLYEQAGIAQFGGVQSHAVATLPSGEVPVSALLQRVQPQDIHCAVTALVCVENTHNALGGRVLSLDYLQQLGSACSSHGIPLHMDGARLFNAVVSSECDAPSLLQHCSSASICLSKGLGCPVGSLIVGDQRFIDRCRRARKALGGGMRQAGVVAAAGLHALTATDYLHTLQCDHRNARHIAQELSVHGELFRVLSPVESNMVMLELPLLCPGDTAQHFADALTHVCADDDVSLLCLPWSASSLRLVTHCDVTSDMTQLACEKMIRTARQFCK